MVCPKIALATHCSDALYILVFHHKRLKTPPRLQLEDFWSKMASFPSSSILPAYASSHLIVRGPSASSSTQTASATASPLYHALPGNGYKEEYVPCPTFDHKLSNLRSNIPMVTFDSIETATNQMTTCNGTSMKKCIDRTGLLDPHTSLFSTLHATEKPFVIFVLTVSLNSRRCYVDLYLHLSIVAGIPHDGNRFPDLWPEWSYYPRRVGLCHLQSVPRIHPGMCS